MELAFWIIGIAGAVFALATFFGADVFDMDTEILPDRAISATSVAASLSGFGFGGVIAIGTGVESSLAVFAIAIGASLVGWVLSLALYRVLKSQETPGSQSNMRSTLEGTEAIVDSAPRGEGGWGELSTTFRGQYVKINFQTEDEVSAGDTVVIDRVISDQQARVSKVAPSEQTQ